MRWDRLFAEIELSAADAVLDERDALAEDLADEAWAERSWAESLAGDVVLQVLGAGEVRGRVQAVMADLIALVSGQDDVLVARQAVMAAWGRRGAPSLTRRGWAAVFRAARDDCEPVRLTRLDGTTVEGQVMAVMRDAVLIAAGREVFIPWSAVAVLRHRR